MFAVRITIYLALSGYIFLRSYFDIYPFVREVADAVGDKNFGGNIVLLKNNF